MKLSNEIIIQIENADHKALATFGRGGVNVAPVSVVKLVGDTIWLHDFYMGKTIENLKENSGAALAFWRGFSGVQVKGDVVLENEGARFEAAKAWIGEHYPDRTLRRLLVLYPQAVFDLSVGTKTMGQRLA